MRIEEFAEAYLTPPERKRYLANATGPIGFDCAISKFARMTVPQDCLYKLVRDAFNWRRSPEGHEYWHAVTLRLYDKFRRGL